VTTILNICVAHSSDEDESYDVIEVDNHVILVQFLRKVMGDFDSENELGHGGFETFKKVN